MADIVEHEGVGYKRRQPWGVFGLSIITFGIYFLVWWYKINNELNNYGVENRPALAMLAWLVPVANIVTSYKTADRILKAQETVGSEERMIPWLALAAMIIVGPFALPYYQSQINKVWDELA